MIMKEASYILPCKLDTAKGEKAQMAHGMIERLKGLIQKLPYQNYITLARLLFHLNRSDCHLVHVPCQGGFLKYEIVFFFTELVLQNMSNTTVCLRATLALCLDQISSNRGTLVYVCLT